MPSNGEWWTEKYGFFGKHYIEGDNSLEGYLTNKKQTLSDRTQKETEGIIALLQLKGKEKILDAPCGYGRHSIELVKKGFQAVGIDINSIHLNKARKDAEKEKLSIQFKKIDMAKINFNQEFDAIINMFFSFGFFETDDKNQKVLEKFFKALKKGGKLLCHTDVNVPRVLKDKYKLNETRNLKSGNGLIIKEAFDPKTKRINGSWTITTKNRKETTKEYSVRVYTKNEFIEMAKKAGFTVFEAYGNWDKEPYSEESEDMIIITKK